MFGIDIELLKEFWVAFYPASRPVVCAIMVALASKSMER